MTNVSRDVLQHAILLDQGARRLHREKGLQPGFETTLLTADAGWNIRTAPSQELEHVSAFSSRNAARIGHLLVSGLTDRVNTFGQTAFVNVNFVDGEQAFLAARYAFNKRQKRRVGPDYPYSLTMSYGRPDIASRVIARDSAERREITDRFMALSLSEVAFVSERSHEATESDYRKMESAVSTLARTHSRAPLDNTVYYFNAGNHTVQIIGHNKIASTEGVQVRYRGWVNMNIYRNDEEGWQLAAAVNAQAPTNKRPAYISSTVPTISGELETTRKLFDDEMAHALDIFESLCLQSSEYSVAYAFDPSYDKILEQEQLSVLDTSMLPVSPIDIGPLHLGDAGF